MREKRHNRKASKIGVKSWQNGSMRAGVAVAPKAGNRMEDYMAERSLENMSERDFRDLQEAPLSHNDAADDGERIMPLEPTGQALETNELSEQSNTFGGQVREGTRDDGDDDEDSDGTLPAEGFVEILESDMDEDFTDGGRPDSIHSPEMSDMNNPGEIDIEDLDEEALSEILPPDARLDPIEE
jgi:hypothetical protein